MTAYTIIKRDAQGDNELSYHGVLFECCDEHVCIDAVFGFADRDLGYMRLRRGDLFREWFFRDRWFNIFRVQDGRDGQLRGWYCNITRPPQFGVDWIAAEDLCLDVFVCPDGRTLLLDEEDFDRLRLPQVEQDAAQEAVQAIREMVRSRTPPFDEINPVTGKPN